MAKKIDEQVLFDEVKIGKYVVKPWSFGVLFDVSDMIDDIFVKLEKKKVDISKEVAAIADAGEINLPFIARLFSVSAYQIRKIMAITLDISEEEVNELNMTDGVKIAATILRQNFSIIKNAISSSLPEIIVTAKEEGMGEEEK